MQDCACVAYELNIYSWLPKTHFECCVCMAAVAFELSASWKQNFWSWSNLQVSIPLGTYENLPVAISLLAKHGSDGFLLNLVETLHESLKEQIEIAQESSYWELVTCYAASIHKIIVYVYPFKLFVDHFKWPLTFHDRLFIVCFSNVCTEKPSEFFW